MKGPDRWGQLEHYKPLVDDIGIDLEGTQDFNQEEKARIRHSIEGLRESVVKTFEPSEAQLKFIDERLLYLATAVDRLNRIDWRALAISTAVSIAINLSLDTNSGRDLFKLFQEAFKTSFKLLN